MQKHRDGTIVVSATDLVGFLACDHLISLELERIAGLRKKPVRYDPELELLQERGDRHEHAYLERLRAAGRSIVEIPPALRSAHTPDELRAAAEATRAAMAEGADVVFQATFFDGRWRGHADFLIRADRPSRLGDWSYDVADTKLARHVKGERTHPDVRVRRPARPGPGRAARDPHGRHRRRRPARPPVRRLRCLPPPGQGALRGARLRYGTRRADVPRPGRPLPGLQLVADLRRPATRPTTTCRSWRE